MSKAKLALGLVVAWALIPAGAMATIKGTAHDFSSKAPGGQLCVACHNPHGVPSTLLLWNHTYSANNFSWSDATNTTAGTTLPTNIKSWSGGTKNCLSCHDGSVAIGAIVNPASTFDATKITGAAQVVTATGDMKGNHPVAIPYPTAAGAKYNAITTGVTDFTGYVAAPTKVALYTDPAAAAPNNKGIECASCHDPHGTVNVDFLRDGTTGSALCLDCHNK